MRELPLFCYGGIEMTKEALQKLTAGTVFQVTEIMDGVYRVENSSVFMDLIVGSHHALLFDTGYGFDDLHALVRRITELPLYVVNSHGHVDHACGNWQFPEVFIHPEDVRLCMAHNSPEMRREELEKAVVPENFDLAEYLSHDCGKLRPVVGGEVFDLGGRTLEVVELPGHTRGSIGLLWREERMLYVGDAVNGFLWLFLPEATSVSVYRDTLYRVRELPFDRMIQSHEPRVMPRSCLDDYIRLVETMEYDAWPAVDTPLAAPGQEIKIITLPGNDLADAGKPGFAAIMISRDKLG